MRSSLFSWSHFLRKTGVHPGSSPGQAFSGKCFNEQLITPGETPMYKTLCTAMIIIAGTVAAAAQTAVPSEVVKDLAPTGKLRAAINLGNSVLAQKDAATGEPKGITVDLARELGKRIGVPVELVTFEAPARRSRPPRPARSTSCSSPSSRCAPPRSPSPRPTSSSRAFTWCRRIPR
jgi:hypothetical protein